MGLKPAHSFCRSVLEEREGLLADLLEKKLSELTGMLEPEERRRIGRYVGVAE